MNPKESKLGYSFAAIAYLIWGSLTIYWKQLPMLNAIELLTVRVLFSVVTLLIVVHLTKNTLYISYLKDRKTRNSLFVTALLIGTNWGVFVYAINSGHVLQTSLGYYIGPLISVFLGVVILKEKLNVNQYIAIGLALIGILYLILSYGVFPWIAIVIGSSFSMYGLFKKIYHLNSLNSLLVEAILLLPIMITLTIIVDSNVQSQIHTTGLYQWIFIVFAGAVTITPLIIFAEGAKRIPLNAIGFLQYITPTMFLLSGVLIFGETFTKYHAVSFGLIWSGIVVNFVGVSGISLLRKWS
jgi:chloramphenicol-sensitive protein RarD